MCDTSEALVTVDVALKQLTDAIDTLLAVDLSAASRDELLELAQGVEVQRRRLPVADHRLISELDWRGVAGELCRPSTRDLLVQLLRLSADEAAGRIVAAEQLGDRRAMTGAPVEPLRPVLAAAQAEGAVSDRQAALICRTIRDLPDAVRLEHEDAVEQVLTDHARELSARQLGIVAKRLVDCLDPDGTLGNDRDHERRRDFTMLKRSDGSGKATIELTPTGVAITEAWLDALAAPVPSTDDVVDTRTAGQRRYDAFEEVGRRAMRAGELPDCGGLPVTLIVTMTADQLLARRGVATNSHGDPISVTEALRLATEAEIIPVVLNDTGGVLAYGRSKRIAPPAMRQVLIARDRGCCFPGCDRPPQWTEVHHIVPWLLGGRTDLDNCCLVCRFHHREFEKREWECRIIDGVPHWIAPPWLDRTRTPRRNTINHPGLSTPP